jgi:hypothetical protein
MNSQIYYADLWAMLKRLGYNCERLMNENKNRVCEHPATGSMFSLADYPPDQPVHPQTLYGVRLELDNFGLMSREEFNHWVERRTRINLAKANGSNGTERTGKPTKSIPGSSS